MAPENAASDHGTGRIAALDLLRGVAAFGVAIPHFLIANGIYPDALEAASILSVEIFFALSGFVLAPQILSCVRRGTVSALRIFLLRRWMRTVPPYLVALMAASYLSDTLLVPDVIRYIFYVQNLFNQHNIHDYFPVAWSLSVEEWFYVTFPALLLFLAALIGRSSDRMALLFALGFICAITILRTVFGDFAAWGPEVRRVVAFRLDSIAYGFVLFVAMRRFAGFRTGSLNRPATAIALLVFVITMLVAFQVAWQIGTADGLAEKHLFPFLAAGFGCSTIFLLCSLEGVVRRWKPLAALSIFMGRVSYSVYLFHLIYLLIIRSALAELSIEIQMLVYLACCLGFSTIFYYYFERGILAARPQYDFAAAALALPADSVPDGKDGATSRPLPGVSSSARS